jgi:hypothetical protein
MSNPNLLTPQDEQREADAVEREANELSAEEITISQEMLEKIVAELGSEAVAEFQAEAPNN